MTNYANRGSVLELMAEQSNRVYLNTGKAHIRKNHTGVKTVRGGAGNIEKVWYDAKTGLDFTGLLAGGRYISFDCKQTKEKTRFPLQNIKEHQIDEMKRILGLGGVAFLLVYFDVYQEAYILTYDCIKKAMDEKKKSIQYVEFKNMPRVKSGSGCALDYLKEIHKIGGLEIADR